MGRKPIARKRKPLTDKARVWVRQLVPLLQDQDLEKLTLDELAELMGKSKSTIYSYFSTKEEIYQTAVQLVLDELVFVISPEAIKGEDMELVLRSMLLEISEGIEGISIRFLEQIQDHFPEIWLTIEHFTDKLLSNFEVIYKEGMRSGTFKQFNLPLILALDRHFVMSIMTDSNQFSSQMELKELVRDYLELRLSALLVR
jgi:AcrR family transcriptional regulator